MGRFGLSRFDRVSFRPILVSRFGLIFFNLIYALFQINMLNEVSKPFSLSCKGTGFGKFASSFYFKNLSSLIPNHRFKFNFKIFFIVCQLSIQTDILLNFWLIISDRIKFLVPMLFVY